MDEKKKTDSEIMKANIDAVFKQICDKSGIDRCTLYVLIGEIMEEDGFVEFDHVTETLH